MSSAPEPNHGRLGWRAAVRIGVVVTVLGLATLAVLRQWDDVADELAQIGLRAVVISCIAASVGMSCTLMAWRSLLADLGSPLKMSGAIPVFFVGQLGKYVPGSVWPVVAQMSFARDHGVPRRTVATAFVSLTLVTVVSGVVVACATLPLGDPDIARRYWWVALAVPVGLVLLHPPVFLRCAGVLARVLRRPVELRAVSRRGVLLATAWTVLTWLAYGVHLFVLSQRLGAGGPSVLITCIGAFALAWCAGFVFILVPAGLGVREAALVFALRGTLTTAAATALALTSRLVMTVVELAWGAIGAVLMLGRRPAPARTGSTQEEPGPTAL